MTLSGFILFTLGVLAELVILFERKALSWSDATGQVYSPRGWAFKESEALTLWQRLLSPGQVIILLLAVPAALLIGLFELFGAGKSLVYIDTPLISLMMVALLLLVLAAAVMAGWFLPTVTEQGILVVQMLVLAGALIEGQGVDWLPGWAVILLPAGLILLLALWPRAFPAPVKAAVYLWYLLSLLIIPFQSGQVNLLHQLDLTWPDAYALGMLLAFLILHGLFAVRFLIITLSMARPRNRVMVAQTMPSLFTDEQVPLRRTLLVIAGLGGLLYLNHLTQLLTMPVAFSLASLIAVQVLNAHHRFIA